MPTDTPELHFARRITGLGGWLTPSALTDDEGATVADWLRDGRLAEKTSGRLDPRRIVELTDAGWSWCREHGVG